MAKHWESKLDAFDFNEAERNTIIRFLSRRPAETANKYFTGRDELIATRLSTVLDVVSGKVLSLYPCIIG